jgi:hypothetical protein
MARGGPDYGNPGYHIAIPKLDIGELETLLLGQATIDGKGRIFSFNTFQRGFGFAAGYQFTGGDVPALESSSKAVNGVVAKYNPGGTSSADISGSYVDVYYPGLITVGVELYFDITTTSGDLQCRVHYAPDIKNYHVGLTYNPSDRWLYLQNGYDYTGAKIIRMADSILTERAVRLKIVADFEAGYYRRLVVGRDEVDISGYALAEQISYGVGMCRLDIRAVGATGRSGPVYLRGWILTEDEP